MVGTYADLPLDPLSDHYGLDRGTPLDRRYIEAFLAGYHEAIRGSVLEVQDDTYTRTFGADRVSTSTVVDINDANPLATLVVDLCDPASLPADAYDCILLTQTLHLLRRPELCVDNCHRALRPGGTLLATAPSLSRVSPTYPDADFWRFTPAGLAELFTTRWLDTFSIHAYGNLRTCIGFLLGQVVEEVPEALLDHKDPRYPLTVAVRGPQATRVKHGEPASSDHAQQRPQPGGTSHRKMPKVRDNGPSEVAVLSPTIRVIACAQLGGPTYGGLHSPELTSQLRLCSPLSAAGQVGRVQHRRRWVARSRLKAIHDDD